MNIGEWLGSKKTKTAILTAIVPIVAHYLGIPQEVALAACGGLITAILGFAHQDYAKARSTLSGVQLDDIAASVVRELSKGNSIEVKVGPKEPK